MTTSPTMPTSLVMPVIERFRVRIDKEMDFLNRLDTNGGDLRGDGDTGSGLAHGLSESLPALNFAEFTANFNKSCVVSLGRAYQGGLWPAISDLWMPYDTLDADSFLAAFRQAADKAPHEYYPPFHRGTVLEAFAVVANLSPAEDGLSVTLAAAKTEVASLAVRSNDPGVYTIQYFLESFGEVWP